MKQLLTLLLLAFYISAQAQQHSLEKIWETDSVVAVPESVLPVTSRNLLYISLINGAPWEMDGKGGVGKLGIDGKNYDSSWVTGLHAPKGMGVLGNKLYIADISNVVVVNLDNGKIEKTIAIDSAKGLNDITISDKGIVYVSDSRTAKIWRLENDKPSLFLENMQGVNGLKAIGSDLIIASGKSFVRADADKKIHPIAELPQGGDGIEPIGNGDYLVTSWSGYIFYVYADGKVETILDTHLEKRNTADIGYDSANKIVYVPTFNAKTIVAYRLVGK